MDEVEANNEDKKELIVNLEDFAFICRICCLQQSDLRLFQKDYLLDLFQAIRNVDVHSSIEYPRKICNGCVNQLADISLFIEISKNNDADFRNNMVWKEECIEHTDYIRSGVSQVSIETEENNEEVRCFQKSPICRICFSPSSSLTPFEEVTRLVHLFQNITNIDVKPKSSASHMNSICYICIEQLQKISLFINSSLCYDQKLEHAMARNEAVNIDSYSDPIDIKLATCQKLERGYEIDEEEATDWNICGDKTFVHESSVKVEIIDIKEDIFDRELVASTEQLYENGLSFHYKTLPEEKPFNGAVFKEGLAEELPSSLHIESHNNEVVTTLTENLFECDFCKKSFTPKDFLQHHMFFHTGGTLFKCGCCERRFTEKSALQKHMRTHTGEKPFKCDCCEKSFKQTSHLNQHMLAHTGEKPFKCDCCGKSFARKSILKYHMQTHTGEKPVKCDCCEKSFRCVSILQEHLRAHVGEKQFECNHCEKSFTNKSGLKRHLLIHTGDKPFKCDSCEKSFAQNAALQTHLLTHTAEKPFQCDNCKKSFATKSKMKRHLLIHTR